MKEALIFELTSTHIKVLKNTYNNNAARTPLGLARLAGIVGPEIVGLSEAEEQQVMKFNAEMPTAMQIVLGTTSFVPGLYRNDTPEDAMGWVLEKGL